MIEDRQDLVQDIKALLVAIESQLKDDRADLRILKRRVKINQRLASKINIRFNEEQLATNPPQI